MIQINLPETASLKIFYSDIIPWLKENMEQQYVWIWPDRYITLENDDDATMFMLKFGGYRTYSRVEQMIKVENDNNS